MGTRGVRGSRGAPALTLDARCLSLHGDLCIPSCRRMGWSQTIPLYLTPGGLWTPWSPVFSPSHYGEAQRGEGTCLQSHSMPTGDLVPNLLLFPSNTFQKKPTFALPRKHHPAQQTGTLGGGGLSSLQSGQDRREN